MVLNQKGKGVEDITVKGLTVKVHVSFCPKPK